MADAWGGSWGSSWGSSWSVEAVAVTPVTTAGPARSYGTQYARETLSRKLRDKARAERKAAKKIEVRVVAKLRKADWFSDEDKARQAVQSVRENLAKRVADEALPDGSFDVGILIELLRSQAVDAALRIAEDDDLLLLLAA